MADLVVDTCALAELLSQYFCVPHANFGYSRFVPSNNMARGFAKELNRILVNWAAAGYNASIPSDVVVISTFAFVEIARKWDTIVNGRFTISQLRAFLNEPPSWINIAPLDIDLLPSFASVPQHVRVRDELKPIEWADAVHVATAFSRGIDSLLVTSDERLSAISGIRTLFPNS